MKSLDLREGLGPRPGGPEAGDWAWHKGKLVLCLLCADCRKIAGHIVGRSIAPMEEQGIESWTCEDCLWKRLAEIYKKEGRK